MLRATHRSPVNFFVNRLDSVTQTCDSIDMTNTTAANNSSKQYFPGLAVGAYFQYNDREIGKDLFKGESRDPLLPEWSGVCRKYDSHTSIDEYGVKFRVFGCVVVRPSC